MGAIYIMKRMGKHRLENILGSIIRQNTNNNSPSNLLEINFLFQS